MFPTTTFPPLPGIQAMMEHTAVRVLRRVRVGESSLKTPQFVWQQVAVIRATIHPLDGSLRMGVPGATVVSTHRLWTAYRRGPDGRPVVRAKDIVVADGEAYLVKVVADEDGAQVMLRAELEHGTLNQVQHLAEQG